jgi:hypothetical protein
VLSSFIGFLTPLLSLFTARSGALSTRCIILVCPLSIAVLLPVCEGAQLVRQSRGTLLLKQVLPRKTGKPVEAPDDLSASVGRLCWSLWITGRWPTFYPRHSGASLNRYPSRDVTGERYPPPAGQILHQARVPSIQPPV